MKLETLTDELHEAVYHLNRHLKHLNAAAEDGNWLEVFSRTTGVDKYNQLVQHKVDNILNKGKEIA